MSSTALAGRIQGLREAKAAFQALPEIVRDRMLEATDTTVREIARGARGRVLSSPSVRTRRLLNSISFQVTRTNGRGRVGLTADVDYGRFVEFGTRSMDAEPFMIPAAKAETLHHLERCKVAGRGIERDAAAIGQRTL